MKMRNKPPVADPTPEDPTAWLINGSLAEFVLMHTYYIKCMVMLGYTFMHGKALECFLQEEDSLYPRCISPCFVS